MISEIALKHFDQLWKLFDGTMFSVRGSDFLIEPFREYLPFAFAQNLTAEEAHDRLHRQLQRWGQIEQREQEIEIVNQTISADGSQFVLTQFNDPDVRWARKFILSAFYNLCALAAYKKTIEELVLESWYYVAVGTTERPPSAIKAFRQLVGISNVFLTAEWAREIVVKAVSSDDWDFFTGLGPWLSKDMSKKRFSTARAWLGATMLWYLGGKDIHPRRDFLTLLQDKGIIAEGKDEESFFVEIRRLKLLR